jgi:hypothetical protein
MDDDLLARRTRDLGLDDEDVSAWRRSGLPDPAVDESLADRIARRPSGV